MTADSFHALHTLPGTRTRFFDLGAAERAGAGPLQRLPYSTRVLVENLLRHEDGRTVHPDHVRALATGDRSASIPFTPERVLLQDASGLPVLADMITLSERARQDGLDPASVSPRRRMDLVVDHALEVDIAATPEAAAANLDLEYRRHADRYRFLRWAQSRFPTLRVVPPGLGICHQLNLEVLADVVSVGNHNGGSLARFDSVVGTDSHTTMINALSVVGWGVGGIEATAAALSQPILLPVPSVVGVHLTGALRPGVLATDVALTLASMLRAHGVVQRIVEFHGPGLAALTVPDRGTIANMAPEYGATMAYFPADEHTLAYLATTGRPDSILTVAQAYLTAQNMLYSPELPIPEYDEVLALDLSGVERTMAGPSRPHQTFAATELAASAPVPKSTDSATMRDGDVVIAAITSCTNTSNPKAMIAAGLLARNAVERGLTRAPWTKTSLTPGSRATADLLHSTGLQKALDELGFHVAGFGCGTCMGNSGPLDAAITGQVREQSLSVAAVLSGNRNFPGRIHPDVALSYLASPPMVVAMAIAGRTSISLADQPITTDRHGKPVYLDEIWPTDEDIDAIIRDNNARPLDRVEALPLITTEWHSLPHPVGDSYDWDDEAGMIRRPPFADPALTHPVVDGDILAARPLLLLGDGVTTDHISPVARILPESPAGQWLAEHGVAPEEFGSYSARRLNHDVMVRGGFANPRLENRLTPGKLGPWTRLMPDGDILPVHDAATVYASRHVPTVVVAGHSYGTGSARDWAAKVTRLLGVRAVIAQSFERIHRTNLVAMGVLPVECPRLSPADLSGDEEIEIVGLNAGLGVHTPVLVKVRNACAGERRFDAHARIDTRSNPNGFAPEA
ncbi:MULTISPECIES: aconitate hydratase AcnA [Rhodococcus]|uniref:aconitate hydratase AcnA n=1 Tax=Rhodococcus TaxID=1827 RepID=UPI00193C4024|nr:MULTISPECIES: aconitate hydratase AcnA [Rhodococcus]QRI76697.1 aconitate hydratase AcnA [Rhodococcus aetherivorans]QSE60116.1 aconitate hydratase AcnA [Rhodococcus sp. PSBB066]QSE68579.1 aconitate hydratase AcnA [Rhodococcus sp. PSBB049]